MKQKLNKKYHELIRHINKLLTEEDLAEFTKYLNEVAEIEKLSLEAADILEEVRTGEDFECVCHEMAAKLKGEKWE